MMGLLFNFGGPCSALVNESLTPLVIERRATPYTINRASSCNPPRNASNTSAARSRYEQLTSLLAKAIQQIATITGTFKDALVSWLGSASNGLTDLFASVTSPHPLPADDLTKR
jgi:hypothetical protein